jgi:hypothetical protein
LQRKIENTSMEEVPESFSKDTYLDGLRTADDDALQLIYGEFRRPIVRAVTALGGSEAAGGIFFQTAVIEAARQARKGEVPADIPFPVYLKALAITHFRDWLAEREQEEPPVEEPLPDEPDASAYMPPSEQLRATRAAIMAWRKPAKSDIIHHDDPDGHRLWQQMRVYERRISDGEPISGTPPERNRWMVYTAVGILFTIGGIMAYNYFSRTQTPEEVYQSNFNPPKSIMDDLGRLGKTGIEEDSASEERALCLQRMADADVAYKAKNYKAAADQLADLSGDDNYPACQSDALFYLGIIGLQIERPSLTLQCFSKIDNLERYGEDLYWYQALAFVKLASQNPNLREKAVGAVERARSNTQDPQRRTQAEKILKELSE